MRTAGQADFMSALMSKVERSAGRGVWLVLAQALSSAGSLLVTVAVARSASQEVFLLFALLLPLVFLSQRLVRIYLLIPRQLVVASRGTIAGPAAAPVMSVMLLSFGLAASVLVIGLSRASEPTWVVASAAALPIILIYDCVRNEYVASRRFSRVAGVDAIWLVFQCAGSMLIEMMNLAPIMHVWAWCVPPGIVAALSLRSRRMQVVWAWRRACDVLAGQAITLRDGVGDLLMTAVSLQVVPYMVIFLATSADAAGLRGGQTLLGPVNVVIMGLVPLVQLRVAQSNVALPDALKGIHAQSALVMGVACAYALPLLAMPDSLGTALLGQTWAATQPMLVGLALHLVLRAPAPMLQAALRSLRAFRDLSVVRVLSSIGLIVGAGSGTVLGAPYIPVGMALGEGAAVVMTYWLARRGMSASGASQALESERWRD